MTDPLTDRATVCPCCLQRIVEELDPKATRPPAETKAQNLVQRVEELARKCLKHDPSLDHWQDRRDLK